MSVRKPQRRYGWTGASIQVGSRVRYKRDVPFDPRDVGYALSGEDLLLPAEDIVGTVMEGPDEDDEGMDGLWYVWWDNVCWHDGDPLEGWWTLEELLELA